MFKAFNSKQLTNNKHIILGSREKQYLYLLFSLVHLILCWAGGGNKHVFFRMSNVEKMKKEV